MKKPAPRETILSLFNQAADGFVSGAQISAELGVSRTAVWKHIRSLRQAGYKIDAIPSRGYQLVQAPDILVPEAILTGLGCRLVGSRVCCLDVTDSTNLQACRFGDGAGGKRVDATYGTFEIATDQSVKSGGWVVDQESTRAPGPKQLKVETSIYGCPEPLRLAFAGARIGVDIAIWWWLGYRARATKTSPPRSRD